MNGYILDTSFLSAFYNTKDLNHQLAVDTSKDIDINNIIIPLFVIAELASFRKNTKFRDLMVHEAINIACETPSISSEQLGQYLEFVNSLPSTITTIDSFILFLSKEYNAQLVSFDKRMMKLFKSI